MDNIIWEEKNLIEPEKNYLNNSVRDKEIITKKIESALIKKDWKDTTKISGIYVIYNKINKKSYLGSSNNIIKSRWKFHLYNLCKNKHANTHLQSAWNLYGKENFEFLIIESCDPKNTRTLEQLYLNTCKTYQEMWYNNNWVVSGSQFSESSKQKHKNSQKKRWADSANRKKASEVAKKWFTDTDNKQKFLDACKKQESRIKISNSRKKYLLEKENLNKLKDNIKKYFQKSENKQKHSENKKQFYSDKENIKKHSEACRNKTIHIFENEITGEQFTGTRYDFERKYKLNNITLLLNGKLKTVKKWKHIKYEQNI